MDIGFEKKCHFSLASYLLKKKHSLIHYCQITGIEYMLEFVREDDPDDVYYVCEMCKCRLSSGSVMAHLTGSRHGVAYVVSDNYRSSDSG